MAPATVALAATATGGTPSRLALPLTLALALAAGARAAEFGPSLSLAMALTAAVQRLQLADGRIHRVDVRGVVGLGSRLLRGLLLGLEELLEARHGVGAGGFEAGFALDFLPVHLDGRDKVRDFV